MPKATTKNDSTQSWSSRAGSEGCSREGVTWNSSGSCWRRRGRRICWWRMMILSGAGKERSSWSTGDTIGIRNEWGKGGRLPLWKFKHFTECVSSKIPVLSMLYSSLNFPRSTSWKSKSLSLSKFWRKCCLTWHKRTWHSKMPTTALVRIRSLTQFE